MFRRVLHKKKGRDPSQYLTFKVTSGSLQFKFSAAGIKYSTGDLWTILARNTYGPSISSGNSIMWKASFTPDNYSGCGYFSMTGTGTVEVEGNIMSLIYEDNFEGQTSLTVNNIFKLIFYNCIKLTNAENLVLPATTLTNYCYFHMFYGCSKLNYIYCTATNIQATECLSEWVYEVSPTGTFIKSYYMNNWTTGYNGIPNGWNVDYVF